MIDQTDKRVMDYLHSKWFYGEELVFWPADLIAASLELPRTQVDASLGSMLELGWVERQATYALPLGDPAPCYRITETGVDANPFYGV